VVIPELDVLDFCFRWHFGCVKSLTFRLFNAHWLDRQSQKLLHFEFWVTEFFPSNFCPIDAIRKVIRCAFDSIFVENIIRECIVIMRLCSCVKHHQTHISVDNTVLTWEWWNNVDRVPFILIFVHIVTNKSEDRLCALRTRGFHECFKATVHERLFRLQETGLISFR